MGHVRILNEAVSYLNQILREIRDKQVQQDQLRFRQNLEKAGTLLAYEISREFHYQASTVETPMGPSEIALPQDELVIGAILRAALPMHHGFQQLFDQADNAFISAYRDYKNETEFDIHVEYLAAPRLEGKTLILVDPMVATGQSMVISYQALVRHNGQPARTFIASLLGAKPGLHYVQEQIPEAQIYLAGLDSELTAQSFIYPGLGDAGDLAFGTKV
jgi:uracil phosphoribosyltransferase